eukprot:PLAT14800.1.p1 GENE.PLAT14800.1~~PLAT14800.1.p1  ORF type:complete len:204 (-),score=24.49 PLAT14800.1:118-729(-)
MQTYTTDALAHHTARHPLSSHSSAPRFAPAAGSLPQNVVAAPVVVAAAAAVAAVACACLLACISVLAAAGCALADERCSRRKQSPARQVAEEEQLRGGERAAKDTLVATPLAHVSLRRQQQQQATAVAPAAVADATAARSCVSELLLRASVALFHSKSLPLCLLLLPRSHEATAASAEQATSKMPVMHRSSYPTSAAAADKAQ